MVTSGLLSFPEVLVAWQRDRDILGQRLNVVQKSLKIPLPTQDTGKPVPRKLAVAPERDRDIRVQRCLFV